MVLILQAAVLGIVQGLTEFIPISSSGHLVLIPKLFGWNTFVATKGVSTVSTVSR